MRPKFTLALCIALAASIASFGQEKVTAQVDEFIKSAMGNQHIPGLSLAVIKGGKPVIVKGYGVANLEHQVPVKPETIFQSGSVGKQFTAMAVMILVDEGKISLDEKISKYLGDVPPAWANINVRHLLSHTSGMTDYPEDFDFRKDYSEDELLKKAEEIPLAFQAGERWAYSNMGYVVLGILIGKVTGKFYGDFLSDRVFKPLGMTTARVISEKDIVPNRAAGYVLQNGEIKNQAWVSPSMNTTADGSLYLSTLDMIKWEDGLAKRKLLTKQSYEQLWSQIRLNDGSDYPYGFGWGFRAVNGKRVIEHGGAWQGFRSHIVRYIDNDLTVIVFANMGRANVDRIANGVGAIVDPTLKPLPIADKDPALSAEFRKLVEGVLKGSFDTSNLAPGVAKELSDPQNRFLAHLKKAGPIKAFTLVELVPRGDVQGFRYDVEFDSIIAVLDVRRSKDGKLIMFSLQPE
jgi:CubicO group peptidase (beta-lactamase class C family)